MSTEDEFAILRQKLAVIAKTNQETQASIDEREALIGNKGKAPKAYELKRWKISLKKTEKPQ